MALLELQNYILGIVVFCMVVIGGVLYVSPFASNVEDQVMVENFNRTLNKASDVTASVGALEDSIENVNTDFGPLGAVEALLGAAWDILRGIGNSVAFMSVAIEEFGASIGIPPILLSLLGSIIVLIIVFSILMAVMNRY